MYIDSNGQVTAVAGSDLDPERIAERYRRAFLRLLGSDPQLCALALEMAPHLMFEVDDI